MDTLYIVMPAYNEEETITSVVRSWYKILEGKSPDSRMVVADSGSTDSTHEKLLELCSELPLLELLSDTEKQHGPKVIALYRHAIKNGADYIFQTDSDGQTNPDEFSAFWNARAEYACVFGRRVHRGDGIARLFVSRVLSLIVRLIFGVKVPDANAPFRLLNASALDKYLHRLPTDYNLPNIMITTFFTYYGEKMKYIEITFKPRQGGVNSINIPKIAGIGLRALGDFQNFKKGM